jgi:hypothetical protein
MFNDKQAGENLRNLIKPLYDEAGIEWTQEQDEEVEKLIDNIYKMIVPL